MLRKQPILIVALTGAGALAALLTLNLRAAPAESAQRVPGSVHEGNAIVIPERSPLRGVLELQVLAAEQVSTPLVLPASVEADPARLVKVLTPASGRIVRLYKQLGDNVNPGDVLFTMDAPDYGQAASDARKAQAALELARANAERVAHLGNEQIAATRDVEQARSDFEQAHSEWVRAKARLAQLGASASGDGKLLAVRSPIRGRIVDLQAGTGGYWNDTTAPLMTVADLSSVLVTANAQEKDLGQLYAGQQARVQLDALPDAMVGQVQSIGELLDPDTRTAKVRLRFDNPEGRLKPGMFARSTFLGHPHAGLLLPMTAVVQGAFSSRAFVETSPWHFQARELVLGAQVGDKIEVVSGLKPGERVVVRNGVLLND
ncbi:efflux RND transporter periplasmic adaptor subunit [Burkholderiaceae bacterium UC74_6]